MAYQLNAQTKICKTYYLIAIHFQWNQNYDERFFDWIKTE